MPFTELILIGIGRAADAFAVAMCRGFEAKRFSWKNGFWTAFFFGFFQAAMPLIGFLLASLFADQIAAFDHWVAFGLLSFLGLKMIYEGIKEEIQKRREKAAATESNKVTGNKPAVTAGAINYKQIEKIIAEKRKKADEEAGYLNEGTVAEAKPVEDKKGCKSGFDLKGLIVMAFATSIDALIIGVTFAFLEVNIWESVSVIGVITFVLSLFGVFLGSKIGAKLGGKAEILGGVILVGIGLKILLEHLGILVL